MDDRSMDELQNPMVTDSEQDDAASDARDETNDDASQAADERNEFVAAWDEAEQRGAANAESPVNTDETFEPDERFNDASEPFVGRWNRLVSTTNWEKGRIVQQWRDAMIDDDAPASQYSDEAWARRVGGVTGQHVGRLRRVYQRFGAVCETYDGLYWSHFQAAIDWNDAEMWLEGAAQSSWSVAEMRRQRWDSLSEVDRAAAARVDSIAELTAGDVDEDFEPARNEKPLPDTVKPKFDEVHSGPRHDGPDFGADSDEGSSTNGRGKPEEESKSRDDGASIYSGDEARTISFVRPFENLAELPDDLAEAFEAYKLAILRHKLEGWQQISRDDVLASLDALKELAVAPSSSDAPF